MPAANRDSQATDLDPVVAEVLKRRQSRKSAAPYRHRSDADIRSALERFLQTAAPGAELEELARLGGGASKEQFVFSLGGAQEHAGRYVLRMEPTQSISEADRRREFEILAALQGIVPLPAPVWLDEDGEHLGQPAAIMRFVAGAVKPRDNGQTVTGLGTVLGPVLRVPLGEQFIEHLVAIQNLDFTSDAVPSLAVPDADSQQAARWQVNWWTRVWHEDRVQAVPAMALAERWMRDNLPDCDELVVVHGDYRTGNFLFDEDTQRITAILDWELGHVGDHHEDLAWVIQRPFAHAEDGVELVGGICTREEFLTRYEEASGRKVDPVTLHFYEVLASYECLAMVMGTGIRAAQQQHNHQDILLTWLAAVGHIFHTEICDLLEKGPGR